MYPQYTSWDNPKVADRPLVIGYVSPDYFTHSVSYFIEAPLAHHDYSNYKVVVYSGVVKVDIAVPFLVSIFLHFHIVSQKTCLDCLASLRFKIYMEIIYAKIFLLKTEMVVQWSIG